MFPIRPLALIVALTLSTSVPLTACAQAAPAPEAAPAAVQEAHGGNPAIGVCETDADCAQLAYDQGMPIDGYGVDPSKVYDRSKPEGWAAYADPCNWVGQDCYSAVTGVNLTRALAASLIADRMRSGQSISEDWTWQGAPEVVGRWNDDLIDGYQSAYGGTYRFPADVTNGRAAAWLAAGASGVDGDEYATTEV